MEYQHGRDDREDRESICAETCDDDCEFAFGTISRRLDCARRTLHEYIVERARMGSTDPMKDHDLVCISVGRDHPAAYELDELFLLDIIFGRNGAINVMPPADGSVIALVERARLAQMIPVPSKLAAILATRGRCDTSMPMIGAEGPHAILTTYVHAAHTLH
jgi:hypothetical protein